jgi:hypothetical protein
MKHVVAILTAVLFSTGVSLAQAKGASDKCQGLSTKVVALVNDYKILRERRRRLPEGIYDKDLRDDKGSLHRVLSLLGVELGRPPFTKRKIVECLGEPDGIKNGQQMSRFLDIYHRELKKAGRKMEEKRSREYLIYHWRGGHDLMFFISEGGKIIDHGWWFAYE